MVDLTAHIFACSATLNSLSFLSLNVLTVLLGYFILLMIDDFKSLVIHSLTVIPRLSIA